MKKVFKDHELWFVLGFNVLLIALHAYHQLNVAELILLYYAQSVLIGFQYAVRMFAGVTAAKVRKQQANFFGPLFFMFHYGIFHLVYAVFILAGLSKWNNEPGALTELGALLVGLLVSTILSTISDIRYDLKHHQPMTGFSFLPYLRIVPMHLFIIFGLRTENQAWAVYLFLLLKTVSDVVMHVLTHKTWQIERPSPYGRV
jgi:hypothetical protein